MESLYKELCARFPEIETRFSDEDKELPYVLVGNLADWLKTLEVSELTPELTQRVIDFSNWCENQPGGETAADDILTIWMVGFVEKLFESDTTRILLTKLISKQDLILNREYWDAWVESEQFQRVIELYGK